MRVLITGLDGFTGKYLQAELKKNRHEVIGLKSDLLDPHSLRKEISNIRPDTVAHLAGVSFVAHANANHIYNVNLVGSRNLLEALANNAKNLKSVLLASSANVYGNSAQEILDEAAPLMPANDYAVSKLAMEHMARLWMDCLPIFIVRPFNYTGVGQTEKFLIPKIVKHFKAEKSLIELGNINVRREFGDVRTVAVIYRTLLEKCPLGKTVNICTGISYSIREIITFCEKISRHKIKITVNPRFVRGNEVRALKGDNSALLEVIGDKHKTYNIEETLEWMLQLD